MREVTSAFQVLVLHFGRPLNLGVKSFEARKFIQARWRASQRGAHVRAVRARKTVRPWMPGPWIPS